MSLIFRGLSVGTSGGGGGGSANLETLDVIPTTSAQSILPNTGYDGFSLVNVSAVNSSIDANISSENIRNGCEILGVIGSAEAPVYDSTDTKEGNGRYNVAFYNRAQVNVPSEPPAKFGATIDTFLGDIVNGEYPVYTATPADINLPAGITQIEESYFPYRFYHSSTIDSFECHAADAVNNAFNSAFWGSSLSSVKFHNLPIARMNTFNSAFRNCRNLIEANFYSMTNTYANAFAFSFYQSSNLANVNFSNLQNAGIYSFHNAFYQTNIQNIVFNSLTTTLMNSFNSAFAYSKLVSCDFPALHSVSSDSFAWAFKECGNLVTANFTNLSLVSTSYAFANAFASSGIRSIKMSVTTAGSFSNASTSVGVFENCFADSKLSSIAFNNLSAVSGNNTFYRAFYNCKNLTYAYFPKLKRIFKTTENAKNTPYGAFLNAFQYCSNLTSVKMPMLSEIRSMLHSFSNAFLNCPNLSYIEFPALQSINTVSFGNAFSFSGIKNIIFPQLTTATNNSFDRMLLNTTDCVVHFPANMESTINTWNSYASNFNGTNATILFDCYSVSSYYPITENGTMGGDTFAVNASVDSTNAYLAFDGDANTGWQIASTDTPADYVIYAPKAVELTSINVQSIDNNAPTFVNISGSNDGVNWNVMEILVTPNTSETIANFTDPAYYKYYKVVCGAPDGGTMVTINSIDLVGHYIG